jgi:hypothetical protein
MSLRPRYTPEPRPGGVARLLTILVLLLTLLVLAYYVAIFVNPQLPINPFPPRVWVVSVPREENAEGAASLPTFTPPPSLPPTWTPTLTPVPPLTPTRIPTSTPIPPTPTLTPIPPTPRPAQFAPRQEPIFVSQILYPGASGWWTGVAGEVSDLEGNPVTDVTIRIWDDKGHAWEHTPGSAANYAQAYGTSYGGGGSYAWWEQVLEGSCQQSISFHVQVLVGGQARSAIVNTKTTGECSRNLVLVHFVKNW